MEVFLKWLAAYPYILLFFVVGAAVLLGKGTIKSDPAAETNFRWYSRQSSTTLGLP
mgnify:CR=1 FL=1